MVAGTPCQRELGTLGCRRSEKGEKQVESTNLGGREMELRPGTWILTVLGTKWCMDLFDKCIYYRILNY